MCVSLTDLPDDVILAVIEASSVHQAGILKTVSTSMKRLVEASSHEVDLPVKEPEYLVRRTGRYQEKYDSLEHLLNRDPWDSPDVSLRQFIALRLVLSTYDPGQTLSNIRITRYDPLGLVSDIIDRAIVRLRDIHPSIDISRVQRLLSIDRLEIITPRDEDIYGRVMFDALVLELYDRYERTSDDREDYDIRRLLKKHRDYSI